MTTKPRAKRPPEPPATLHPVDAYAAAVLSGYIVAGPYVRQACERHQRDRATGHERGLTFDVAKADRALAFFPEVLRLPNVKDNPPFVLLDWQKFVIGSLFGWMAPPEHKGGERYRRFRTAYLEIGKGSGKALALDTPIPTPAGWTTMAALTPGDQVFDDEGNPCKVTAATEVMRDHACYKVTFDDGAQIVADAEHLWRTEIRRPKRQAGVRLRTTREVATTLHHSNGKYQSANHSVALARPLAGPDRALPIPPYVLGAWLGDGDSDSARFTNAYYDNQIVIEILMEGVDVKEQKQHTPIIGRYLLGSGGRSQAARDVCLATVLRREGLLDRKHIPPAYLRASFAQRQALLQGLMDTDGYIAPSGACEYTSVLPQLADDVHELALSLGLKSTVNIGAASLNGRVVGPKWRVLFTAPTDFPVFRLARKLVLQAPRHNRRKLSADRRIVGCDPTLSVPVKCISVDSPSHMYLAGRHMVPTHNSPMAAGIGLFLLVADGETGAEVYAAAATRDQAKIAFKDAVLMVECAPSLSKRLQKSGIREVTNIAYLKAGSFFRPVSSEGRGLDGKRVAGAIIDELHVHPSAVVVDKMRAGTKGRNQALIVEITNSGVDRKSVCYVHHDYSTRVVSDQVQDDSWFSFVCALDPSDDPFTDESCWIKANPSLGVSITTKYLRERVHEAKGMPAKRSETARFNFCQWVDAGNPAIPGDLWRRCVVPEAEWDDAALRGLRCIGGLDLSGTRDLTALARVYEPDDNGLVHMVVEFWTPGDTMRERAAEEHVPYDLWIEQGYVIATPGRAVDYRWVAQRISELQVETEMAELAYDPYRIKYLEPELQEAAVDIKLLAHGQGFGQSTESGLWMPRSVELLEDLIGKGLLRVKHNPALDYGAASAVHKPDPKGNYIYDKMQSTGRIDGIVAAAMAVGALMGADSGPSGSIFDDESWWEDTPTAPEPDEEAE